MWALPELIEAAARTGEAAAAHNALARLADFTRGGMTDFGLGIEARSRALLVPGPAAETLYAEAITRLGRTRLRTELGRAHLLYGEWLRRENRRTDAREQLRTAHELLSAIGAAAFAGRAQRSLAATGETVRKRAAASPSELTAQEASIARLAVEGRNNPEIGAQLFLSARTVEWHLRKIFAKLGIASRRELRAALDTAPWTADSVLPTRGAPCSRSQAAGPRACRRHRLPPRHACVAAMEHQLRQILETGLHATLNAGPRPSAPGQPRHRGMHQADGPLARGP